ncbi:exodeoxyribonuclease III [Promethearchaeum syntrophicum]|uniref:Exodeoxyribonuclease III n=1 Tax=Promethearchaeum syntrophicum TaxID=2594042 RepID=A0A5B9D9S8_9ARCH|nr:exodeoxyribonuclease III [Candidatus Prometheoarchaeum syntrophicum]QEE15587.1 exonuclease III [Candidatus Prometheoarchaeum syntrophicum]
MKIVSWNVNGINSSLKNNLIPILNNLNADIICLQEIKVSEKTIDPQIKELSINYKQYWNQAERKGYSGVMTLSKKKPISVKFGSENNIFDNEGRLITLEFDNFFLMNAYIPNSGRGLPRLPFKLKYNKNLIKYMNTLKKKKHVILCGDLNVAHKEIDIKNPKTNKKNAGFTQEERDSFSELLNEGYIDTFREFTKDGGHYTWWSYRNNARERNIGWRLDYFVIDEKFLPNLKSSEILPDLLGSDHCPIELVIK